MGSCSRSCYLTALTQSVRQLTTTGNTGTATLSAKGVLNIPQYFPFPLTTTGTNGPATISAKGLNIPDYSISGYTGSFQVVSNIVKGSPTFVTITVTNGVIQTVK